MDNKCFILHDAANSLRGGQATDIHFIIDAFAVNAGIILLHLLQDMGGKVYRRENGVLLWHIYPQCMKSQNVCIGFLFL